MQDKKEDKLKLSQSTPALQFSAPPNTKPNTSFDRSSFGPISPVEFASPPNLETLSSENLFTIQLPGISRRYTGSGREGGATVPLPNSSLSSRASSEYSIESTPSLVESTFDEEPTAVTLGNASSMHNYSKSTTFSSHLSHESFLISSKGENMRASSSSTPPPSNLTFSLPMERISSSSGSETPRGVLSSATIQEPIKSTSGNTSLNASSSFTQPMVPGSSVGMNPVFCLSPGPFTDSDAPSTGRQSSKDESPRYLLSVLLDKETPPRGEVVDVGLAEERQKFLDERFRSFLSLMTPHSVVQHLVPVIVACLENDEQNHDDNGNDVETIALTCLPLIFDAVNEEVGTEMPLMASFVMPLLYLWSATDRHNVQQIASCFRHLLSRMNEEPTTVLLVPIILQMRTSCCPFARSIAAAVLHTIAERPGVMQLSGVPLQTWFLYYQELSKDSCPLVRETAVQALPGWVHLVSEEFFTPIEANQHSLLQHFISDDLSDTVRYLLVDQLVVIAKVIGKKSTTLHIWPYFTAALKDRSWRVRYCGARCLSDMAKLVLDPKLVLEETVRLSMDEEVEIRAIIAEQIGAFVSLVSSSVGKTTIVPVALLLADDESRVVQLRMIAHIAPLISVDLSTARVVCERISAATKKNDIHLQTDALRSVGQLNELLYASRTANAAAKSASPGVNTSPDSKGLQWSLSSKDVVEMVLALAERIIHMSRSDTWRVREAVLQCLPSFALVLSSEQFQKFNGILRRFILDPVSKVRETATSALKAVAGHAGPQWASAMASHLLSTELGGVLQQSAMWRLLTIRCLEALLPTAAKLEVRDQRREKLMPITLKYLMMYSSDSVPTVRRELAKHLLELQPWFFCEVTSKATRSGGANSDSSANAPDEQHLGHFFSAAVRRCEAAGCLSPEQVAALGGRAPVQLLETAIKNDSKASLSSGNYSSSQYSSSWRSSLRSLVRKKR